MQPQIHPLGDYGLLIDWGDRLDAETQQQILACGQALQHRQLPGVLDLIPAYSSLAVLFDLAFLLKNFPQQLPYTLIKSWIEPILADCLHQKTSMGTRHMAIPVCFAAPFAPDLAELAAQKNYTVAAFIQEYCAQAYQVYLIGFLPGFAYMGMLPPHLATPRKANPRTHIPAGSVGIAGAQTGIYPLESPGGWQLIGRTPWRMFTPEKEPPVRLQMGDEVRFYPISESEFLTQNEHTDRE
ncbi:5-oxoprolinase subunit PxpB [Haliscomenobacter sp.]|uniref:5-oxoprolinase subunit PxpB n=1 Tax=Haliscomenobacter sp. TaxID=2717303 RepID=UPI0033651820